MSTTTVPIGTMMFKTGPPIPEQEQCNTLKRKAATPCTPKRKVKRTKNPHMTPIDKTVEALNNFYGDGSPFCDYDLCFNSMDWYSDIKGVCSGCANVVCKQHKLYHQSTDYCIDCMYENECRVCCDMAVEDPHYQFNKPEDTCVTCGDYFCSHHAGDAQKVLCIFCTTPPKRI